MRWRALILLGGKFGGATQNSARDLGAALFNFQCCHFDGAAVRSRSLTLALYFFLRWVVYFMLLLVVFCLAASAIACLWWLLFPERASTHLKELVFFLKRCRKFLFVSVGSSVSVSNSSIVRLGFNFRRWLLPLVHYPRLLWLMLFLLLLPPALVFYLRGTVELEGYGSDVHRGETPSLIAELLRGERLVPPRALPPQVFTSREVERIRPRTGAADRSWDKMDADFVQRLLVVYKVMLERHGYEMVLLEGYRSPERQDVLGLLPGTTNAKAWQSYHQYGLAADSAFLREGKLVITEKDPWALRGYELYGQVAEELGLTWGGRWKLLDFGHVELRTAGRGPSARSMP